MAEITLLDLPIEILQRIGNELPLYALVKCFSCSCKQLYGSFNEANQTGQLFWKTYAIEKFNILLTREELNSFKLRTGSETWKDFVQYLNSLDTSNTFYATENEDKISDRFGCLHYATDAKIIANCCNRMYTCRFCHNDKIKDHQIDRYATQEIFCMRCKTIQSVSNNCKSQTCNNQIFARDFCGLCKFWDDESKPFYHCDFCNYCRVSDGPIKFHCMKCGQCRSGDRATDCSNHRCIVRTGSTNCTVCSTTLGAGTSDSLVVLTCGHFIHQGCYLNSKPKACPVCGHSAAEKAPVAERWVWQFRVGKL